MSQNTAIEVIEKRFSANQFDTTKTLSHAEIQELVRLAAQAPSSFNIQHWRFVAVTDKAAKEKLKAVAYNQPKVADASVTFIVLGDLNGHEKLPEAFAPLLAAKAMDQKSFDGLLGMANGMYSNNPQMRRDEAIRSASMAALNLMNAATARGLISGPMIGFDPEGVKREFGISDQYVPVMLIAVGYEAKGNWPKKPRFAIDKILRFENGREF
jgi:nitroreductase